MKRRGVYPYHFLFLITFLIGTLFHGIAAPACSGFTQDAEENPTDYDHTPNASVEVLPAYYSDSPADHTYIKAMRKNGSCTAWPCFGRDNGGVQLADTKSNIAEAAIPVIGALADTPPCKWPNHYYLIVGVCHQVANRGLYYTGKTVYKARMYKWSSHFYNTYGDCFWPLQKYCHVNCLDSAGQWPPPKTTQDPKAVKESPPHPEVAIYRKHLPEARQAKSRQAYQAVYQSYIDELLEYHIADRLGRDWSRKKGMTLKSLRDETLRGKEVLDLQMVGAKGDGLEVMIEKYNNLYNGMLGKYADVLTDEEYFNFLGLEKGQPVDMKWFLPTSEAGD